MSCTLRGTEQHGLSGIDREHAGMVAAGGVCAGEQPGVALARVTLCLQGPLAGGRRGGRRGGEVSSPRDLGKVRGFWESYTIPCPSEPALNLPPSPGVSGAVMRGVGQPGPDVTLGVGGPHAPPHAGGAGTLHQRAGGDLQGAGPRHPVCVGGGAERGGGGVGCWGESAL